MAKTNITEFSNVASNNTDINNVNIDENCPASNLNNALRELMKALKDVDTGSQALTALSVAGSVTATTSLKTPLIEFTDGDNALTIADGGNVTANADLTVTGDIGVGDDVNLTSDSSQITFGADSEVILAHTHNEGLKLQGSGLNTNFSLLSFDTTDGTIPDLRLGKSSSATVGTFAETANGESIGQIRFTGQDSSNGTRSAGQISVIQSASSTGSSVPAYMRFDTSGSEAMRILSNGNLAINATTDSTLSGGSGFSSAHLRVDTDSGQNSVLVSSNRQNAVAYGVHADGSSGIRYAMYILNGGNGEVGKISYTSTAVSYATTSDHRLKENVEDMTGAIDRVKQLSPKRFNFIADDTNTLVDGFLAHEAQSVVAEAVTGTHNEVDDDGNAVMQGIDQAKLVPLLTGALKEAITKIEALETANTALEARITALENA